MEDVIKIQKVIKLIRESFPDAEKVYLNGSCYKFAAILEEIFPQGNIMDNEDHAIFELKKGYSYDITGRVLSDGYTYLKDQKINTIIEKMNLKYEKSI